MSTNVKLVGFEGISLAAEASGTPTDPSVLLLHGGGQTRHAWGGAATALAAKGWYAVTIDLRGHGDSDWSPDGVYDLDRFAGDAAAAARQFDRPVMVGASLGGISSLTAIGESATPIASALVLVDVTPRLERKGVQRIGDFMRLGIDGFDSLDDVADAVASYLPHRKRPSDVSGLRKNVRQHDDGKWVWHWDRRSSSGSKTRTSKAVSRQEGGSPRRIASTPPRAGSRCRRCWCAAGRATWSARPTPRR